MRGRGSYLVSRLDLGGVTVMGLAMAMRRLTYREFFFSLSAIRELDRNWPSFEIEKCNWQMWAFSDAGCDYVEPIEKALPNLGAVMWVNVLLRAKIGNLDQLPGGEWIQ